MPVYSMTGYASAQSAAPAAAEGKPANARLGLEIRSVNSRFLDLTFKLADDLRAYEPQLRELLAQNGGARVHATLGAFADFLLQRDEAADSAAGGLN